MSRLTLFRSLPYKSYQVLIGGGGFTLFIYGAFFVMKASGADLPVWIWFIGLPIVIIGLLLPWFSNRLRWFYLYLTFVFLTTGLVNAIAFFYVEQEFDAGMMSQIVGLAGIVVFLIVLWVSYRTASLRAQLRRMIVPIGKLDPNTGIVYTPQQAKSVSDPVQATTDQSKDMRKYIPLLIGLGLFVIRTYGAPAESIFFSLFTLLFASLSAVTSGGTAYFLLSIIHWEQQHQMQLRINR